jgi:hypothetical protein
MLGNLIAAPAANWGIRIVVNLAACDVWHLRIQQRGQRAQNAALGLPAQSQQNKVVARQNCIDDLWHYGVIVANDSGKNRPALAKFRGQIVTQFVLHAPAS